MHHIGGCQGRYLAVTRPVGIWRHLYWYVNMDDKEIQNVVFFPCLLIEQCRIIAALSSSYVDIDNAPGGKFNGGQCIKDDDDAWFVVEQIGILSQYFMAASPRHPLIFVALTHLFHRLLEVENIRKQYVPFTTGPGVMKTAMALFMKDKENFNRVTKGKYTGLAGRSVTIEGSKGKSFPWVKRESVSGIHKRGGYAAMGMKHFGKKDAEAPSDSCYEYLYKHVRKELNQQRLQAAEWQNLSS